MRVGIATVHTPGIYGGAEFLVDGLVEAVRAAGHSVHKISMPFYFEPVDAAAHTMDQALGANYLPFNGGRIDRMICLKFPAYMLRHPDKRVWLLHQHRAAYDLYGTPYGWLPGKPETDALREDIIAGDNESLGGIEPGSARAVFTIAERVCQRLRDFNKIESKALYHPPANWEEFRCEEALPYIFVPSRLEGLKRQDLMLKALAACKTPINAVFAGSGGMRSQLESMTAQLGLSDRVRFVGAISREDMLNLYAHASAVFFGPLDEDYGYVTLEAMLSGKPVITCRDSGGPLEFVVNNETGFVTEPDPTDIAAALEKLMADTALAKRLGQNGRARYEALNITWSHVVETLLQDLPPLPPPHKKDILL
ncbi:glycosyltransferase family 4 protein [Rhizobium rhizoryzae]|uniref:Glycosyltransferase involved in cell wall biosynthesis n=1 Tax=Rhizobium rhizoryzae TaxID=451876 RepID=A0A7W6LK14_9HYPH|nr:glycosyltransferase family 4 protein [Rhizobium rhizoryzae]MBB4145790.1 glycosyltransferase involved in cell wall biosynthesis [Rhizobium rhizoryzae]